MAAVLTLNKPGDSYPPALLEGTALGNAEIIWAMDRALIKEVRMPAGPFRGNQRHCFLDCEMSFGDFRRAPPSSIEPKQNGRAKVVVATHATLSEDCYDLKPLFGIRY